MSDSIDSVKQLLRSVLLSSKAGVKASRLQGDYQELCGGYIPHTKFGFSSLHDFIVSISDVVRVGRNSDNELTYFAIADSSTQHIQALVSKQKSKEKPKKKAHPSFNHNKFSFKSNLRTSFKSFSPPKRNYSTFPLKKRRNGLPDACNKENFEVGSFGSNNKSTSSIAKNNTFQQQSRKNKTKDNSNIKRPAATNHKNGADSNNSSFSKNDDFSNSKRKLNSNSAKFFNRQNSGKTSKGSLDSRQQFSKHLPPRFAKKVLATVFSEVALYDNPLSTTSDKQIADHHHSADISYNTSNGFEETEKNNWDVAENNEEINENSSSDLPVTNIEEPAISDFVLDNLKKLLSIYECGLHLSGVSYLYKETFGEVLPVSFLDEIAKGDIDGYVSVEKVSIAGNHKCILFPYMERHSFKEISPVTVFVDAHNFLTMGQEHECLVTFSPSCDRVLVQLVSETDSQKEMVSLIEESYDSLPVSHLVKAGNFVITNKFFRAKVLSVNKKQIEIFRIDYEDSTASYWTSLEKVRPMTPAIAAYPEFCILCKMHRPASEASKKWSSESAKEFSEVYALSHLVINTIAISSIKSQSQYEHTVIFYKITEQYKCNINVRLIEEEYAIQDELNKHTDPFEHQPSTYATLPDEEICELFVFKASCTTEVEVCIIGQDFCDKLQILEKTMFKFYSSTTKDYNLPSPPPCDCVYAVLAESNCTRGKLLSVNGNQGAVYLVDNGETEEVPLQALRPLDKQFADLPMQSVLVSLADLDHEPLSTHCSILQKLSDTVLHKLCPARIIKRCEESSKDARHVVELFCPGDTTVVSVNQMCLDEIIDENMIPILPAEGGFTAVSVGNVDVENSLVFVRLAGEGMVKLNDCLSSLESSFDSENILPSQQVNSIYPGKLCLVSLPSGLFRARVQKLDYENSNNVSVYLVDIGTCKEVTVKSLLKLDDETALTIPPQAVCCKLSEKADKTNYRLLRDVAGDITTLPVLMRVDQQSNNSEDPDVVSMWVNDHSNEQIVAYDCSTVNTLSSNSGVNNDAASVNDSFSLSHPPSNEDLADCRDESSANLEVFSATSSLSEVNHIPSPNAVESGDAADASQKNNSVSKPDKYNFESLHHIAAFMYAKTQLQHYKEVLNLEKNPFLVKVEDAISPDYVQLIALKNLSGRDLLTTTLASFYETQESLLKPDAITIGKSYALCSTSDNSWYRVRVLSMMDDKISVYLYDYGECRVTSKVCLKVLHSQFTSISELIITAKLSGIRPLKHSNQLWPSTVSEKLRSMIKGKCYFAHVLKIIRSDALLKRDVYEVCLCDTTTQDLWINDILVDEWKCANYVD